MAVLSDQARAILHARLMRENTEPFGAITKADLRAADAALDSFLETNATTINNAIPQPARGALSTTQKARLLAMVVVARWGG